MKDIKKQLGIMIPVVLLASIFLGISSVSAEENEVPVWTKTIKLKGDLRLRYQLTTKDESGKDIPNRSRGRIRARIGFGAKIANGVKVGLGVASGGDDPRSTNQSLDNAFSSKSLRLDYAYAEMALADPFTLFAGKFPRKKAVWHPSDLLWDSDINVEGASLVLNAGSLFLNSGFFILKEETKSADPSIVVLQPGINTRVGNLAIKAALAYYAFGGVQGQNIDFSAGSNSLIDSTNPKSGLLYAYDAIAPVIEISIKNPIGDALPYAALFAEYVKNPDPSDKNAGFLVGFKVGDKKVKKVKQWQFKYLYRKLEKDAWLDVLPDSDFAGGKTGYKGHEVIAKVGLKKNVVFALDYYMTQEIDGSKKENIVQVDLNYQF